MLCVENIPVCGPTIQASSAQVQRKLWSDHEAHAVGTYAQQLEQRAQERAKRRLYREAEARRLRDEARKRVISLGACMLERVFTLREEEPPRSPEKVTMFDADKPPAMSIDKYFIRLCKYSQCSAESIVMGLIHINNLLQRQSAIAVDNFNIHRLMLASIMCAAKFYDDQYYNNKFYARIGGVSLQELNKLELGFLALVHFDLLVPSAEYESFLGQLASPLFHQACICDLKMPLAFLLNPSAGTAAMAPAPSVDEEEADLPLPPSRSGRVEPFFVNSAKNQTPSPAVSRQANDYQLLSKLSSSSSEFVWELISVGSAPAQLPESQKELLAKLTSEQKQDDRSPSEEESEESSSDAEGEEESSTSTLSVRSGSSQSHSRTLPPAVVFGPSANFDFYGSYTQPQPQPSSHQQHQQQRQQQQYYQQKFYQQQLYYSQHAAGSQVVLTPTGLVQAYAPQYQYYHYQQHQQAPAQFECQYVDEATSVSVASHFSYSSQSRR